MSLKDGDKMKSITLPNGRIFKFGRNAPPLLTNTPKLKLCDYIDRKNIVLPILTNYRIKADPALRQMYGNDNLGDCVIAGGYHIVGTETGNAGDTFIATSEQIITDYSAIGGYVPGDDSTDNGCDEETALQYWQNIGFANGTKIYGALSANPSNWHEVQTLIYLFENVMYGMALPDEWINPFPSADGFTWDVAGDADPNNSHCVIGMDYNSTGVIIDTWALEGTVTPAATAKYASVSTGGNLFSILTPDQILKGQAKAPNGLAWADLVSDFNKLK
jgi:hypothetical protein